MADIRKRIVFHGRVQGVGFRYTAKYLAQSLGLTGWVRNEWDGTVTLEIQGREMLINKLLVGLNHNQFITIDWMDTKGNSCGAGEQFLGEIREEAGEKGRGCCKGFFKGILWKDSAEIIDTGGM